MKKLASLTIRSSAAICLLCGLATNAKAQSQYLETTVNGGNVSWDDAVWNAANSGANTGPYTSTWVSGQFARFYNSASQTTTITVNNSETMAGLFLNSGTASILNINAAGGGNLNLLPGGTPLDGFAVQGFLTGGGTVNINAPIIGTGAIEEESGGGNLNLFGNNTYSGGTVFSSSATFVGYNNNNSFGTGNIGFAGTTFAILNSQGTAPITLNNNVQIFGNSGVNFIGTAPTISAGTWAIGANALNIRNNGVGQAPFLTISGVMSGSGPVSFSGANGGRIILKGANTYTGATTVGLSGDTSITLELAGVNTIASSSSLILAGGTVAISANQANAGTLGLTSSSQMYFAGAGETVSFARSATLTWSGVLNLGDWNPAVDTLQIGTDPTGVTEGQLADIEAWGDASTLGTATIDANGNILIPEPSTNALFALGGLGVVIGGIIRRRRTA